MEEMSKSPDPVRKPDIVLLPHEFSNEAVIRLWIYGEELLRSRSHPVDHYPMVVKLSLVNVFMSSIKEVQEVMSSLDEEYGLKDLAKLLSLWLKGEEAYLLKIAHELQTIDSYTAKIHRQLEEYEQGSADEGKMKSSLRRFAEGVYKELIERGVWEYLYRAKARGPEGYRLIDQETKIEFGRIKVAKVGDEALFFLSLYQDYPTYNEKEKTRIRLKKEYVKRKMEELGARDTYGRTGGVDSNARPKVLVVAKPEIGKGLRFIEKEEEGLGEVFIIEIPASILLVSLWGRSLDINAHWGKNFYGSVKIGGKVKRAGVGGVLYVRYEEDFKLLMFNESLGVKAEFAIKEGKSDDRWKPINEKTLAELDAFLTSWAEDKENQVIVRSLYPDTNDINDIKERIYSFVKELPWSKLSEYKDEGEERPTVCIEGRESEVLTEIGLAIRNLRLLRDFGRKLAAEGREKGISVEEAARLLTKWTLEATMIEDITEEIFSFSEVRYENAITRSTKTKKELGVSVSMSKSRKVLSGERFVKVSPNSDVVIKAKANEETIYEKTIWESDRIEAEVKYPIELG